MAVGRALSIRVQIYLLLAIPLLTVAVLYSFAVATSLGDAVSLDRAPGLINAITVPMAAFGTHVQDERQASLVYLAHPTGTNRARLAAAQNATLRAFPGLRARLAPAAAGPGATPGEARAIRALLADTAALARVRRAVDARAITATAAFTAYSGVLTDEFGVYLREAGSLTNAHAAVQGLASIDMARAREHLRQEDALLSAALAAHRLTAATRTGFTRLAGERRSAYASGAASLDATNLAAFEGALSKYASPATLRRLRSLEDAVAASRGTRPPVTAAQWQPVASAVARGYFAGGVKTAGAQAAYDRTVTAAAWTRVWLATGLCLLGLAASVIASGLAVRRLSRRLNLIGESARSLASTQLPDVLARLRRGEKVDGALAATPVRLGNDELGRVGEAFDMARRSAIGAAVSEAELRRGISEVSGNLARRSQSLLDRQVAVLDGMERRTSDPAMLQDLFLLSRLTRRMRRHAEGLITLSGAPPSRGWSHPVRLADVLRGAVAEVEDYARVSVTCVSHASLAGPAVADVIHLLAELIENATTLSPSYTTVRVTGDLAAKGFVAEVEDRGLGLGGKRLAELNARLSDPPESSLSSSERLGLFVVARLARRHGIQVTLRPSPYGGVTAIVLIPAELVVIGDSYAACLPAGPVAELDRGRDTVPAGQAALAAPRPGTQLTAGPAQSALTGACAGSGDGPPGLPGREHFDAFSPAAPAQATTLATTPPAADNGPAAPGPGRGGPPPATLPGPAAGLTSAMAAGPAGGPPPATDPSPAAGPTPATAAGAASGHGHGEPSGPEPAPGESGGAPPLPRRVREAGPADPLRDAQRPAQAGHPPAGRERDTAASRSPEEIRAAMSAMQRGWERARAPWGDAPPPPGPGEWETARASAEGPGGSTGRPAGPGTRAQAEEGEE